MATVPISEFEHQVARWVTRLEQSREPLEVSQRGRARIVVLDKETFDQWRHDRERLQALEIKVLVEEGTRAFKRGRSVSHQDLGERIRPTRRAAKRKA